MRIDNLDLEFGDDFSLDLRDVRLSEKLYTATVFTRFFVGLGPFRRIGLFSDVEFAYTWGNGQLFSGRNEPPVDVHQHIAGWNLGMRPGLVAFVTNNLSFEASLGLLGFQYRQTKLYEGGHIVGSRQTSKANFRADLLSLSLGLSLYLY